MILTRISLCRSSIIDLKVTIRLRDAYIKTGYEFTLAVLKNWLNKQALHQIHKPRLKFIQYAFFNDIQDLNEVHQSDTTPFSHCKIGNRIYKHRLVIKDVTTRFHRSFALTNKSSA